MRTSCALLCCLLSVSPAVAQTAAAPTGWARVQAEPKGSNINVKARSNSGTCLLATVTEDTLTCTRKGQDVTYARADILRIRRPHRGRSTLVGLAIGAGGGAAAGAATGRSGDIIGKGGVAAIFAVPLGLVGALIGVTTDFTSSSLYSSK